MSGQRVRAPASEGAGPPHCPFLAGGGQVGALLRTIDWRSNGLGAPEQWAVTLKAAVHFLLGSSQPLCLFWGQELHFFFNDGYLHAMEPKLSHLAVPGKEAFGERWAEVGPRIERVIRGEETSWNEEQPVTLYREGQVERRYFSFRHNPVYEESAPHAIGGVLVLCEDVTAQVDARGQVLEERRRLLQNFEHAPSLMATLRGPEHRFEMANAAFRRLAGGLSLVGRPALEVLRGQDDGSLRGHLDRLSRAEEAHWTQGCVFVVEDAEGPSEHQVDLVYRPTFDHAGRVDGVLVTGHDVTELKRVEEARARAQEMERRLRSAQRMEAIGRLTGRIAHDFNNILAIILGNAELLVEHLADDAFARPQAELVSQAAERGATMMSRLLAYAQRQPLENTRIEPGPFLRRLVSRLARELPRAVSVSLTVEGTPWPVQIDVAQLEKSLEDLLSNAADAMPEGGRVEVRCGNFVAGRDPGLRAHFGLVTRQDIAPGEYVQVVVEDRGRGMTPEVLSAVFEPFFTTKEVGRGTGLGLSMVLGFIRQSQGYVGVVSAPGQGTRFTLLIPRLVEAAPHETGAAARRVVEAPAEPGASVLVVDDEPAMCRHVVAQLIKAGYRAVSAKNPREALALLAGPQPFDLLFTDILMPGGMNGPQLAEEARRLRPSLKVLYTSGYTAQTLASGDGPDLEADLLLTKPFRKSDLLQRVRAALSPR